MILWYILYIFSLRHKDSKVLFTFKILRQIKIKQINWKKKSTVLFRRSEKAKSLIIIWVIRKKKMIRGKWIVVEMVPRQTIWGCKYITNSLLDIILVWQGILCQVRRHQVILSILQLKMTWRYNSNTSSFSLA